MPWARFNPETCLFILLNIQLNSALIHLLHSYSVQGLQAETMLICVSMLVKKPRGELRPLPAPAEAGMFLHGREELISLRRGGVGDAS